MVKVRPSKYRPKSQIAICFGPHVVKHVSYKEAQSIGEQLLMLVIKKAVRE